MTAELSILIPSRNEEWLSQTVDNLLANIQGDTEILVGMDGYWAEPGVADDKRVKILRVPVAIGQRAMQNRLAKMSRARYVMKLDAHCAVDKGFDVKMMEKMEDDITMVPTMYNLHAFDWICKHCNMRYYQGPEPTDCRSETCSFETPSFEKKVIWLPRQQGPEKRGPTSTAYRFNKNLQFKYFPELRAFQPKTGLAETMSLQGSCFMATREKYWSLKLCDESWGSWGQQGTEVAIKTWLSGGRVLVNLDTWYAHLFRTQKGFSFPYPMSGRDQQRARDISRDVFLNNKWDQAARPLSWLLEKFWPALEKVNDPEQRWTPGAIERQKAREQANPLLHRQ